MKRVFSTYIGKKKLLLCITGMKRDKSFVFLKKYAMEKNRAHDKMKTGRS